MFNKILKIKQNLITNKLIRKRINTPVKPFKTPALFNADNFRSLLAFYNNIKMKYVFHKKTGVMAMGQHENSHKLIAENIVNSNDISLENSDNVIAGYFKFILLNGIYVFIFDTVSSYGNKKDFEHVLRHINDVLVGNKFRIFDQKKEAFPAGNRYLLYIENNFSLFKTIFGK